MYGQ